MGSGRSDIVDVCVFLHHETSKALLVSNTGDPETDDDAVWLPKSLIEFEIGKDRSVTVSAAAWLLCRKGLI
jgi:hypothetical protein